MKNGARVAVILTTVFVCIVLGIFIGRNFTGVYYLSHNESTPNGDTQNTMKIDINTASAKQLTSLPGVGDVLAKRIIAYRDTNGPFESTADLMEVEGIGKSKLLEMEQYITVGG